MEKRQNYLMAHGCLVLLVGLLAGFMLAFGLIGGIEIYPNFILSMPYYGTSDGWVRAHAGGIANGLMMIALALALPRAKLPTKKLPLVTHGLVYMGWANTVFYWFGNAAGSRALSVGDNPLGASNIFGIIGYIGAITAALLTLYIVFILARALLAKS